MMSSRKVSVALVGNPNSGKTSVFNLLTGLHQHTSNFPGTTVLGKSGKFTDGDFHFTLVDLPGIRSLYTHSVDEKVTRDFLLSYPVKFDAALFVADATALKQNLFLYIQLADLHIPSVLLINKMDLARKQGISVDTEKLSRFLRIPVLAVSTHRLGNAKEKIIEALKKVKRVKPRSFFDRWRYKQDLEKRFFEGRETSYRELLFLPEKLKQSIDNNITETKRHWENFLRKETICRYDVVNKMLKRTVKHKQTAGRELDKKLDRILLHPFWGYVIFFLLMVLMFNAVFSWSQYPMDLIDNFFARIIKFTNEHLPPGKLAALITGGFLSGLNGILLFIPPIGILFLFVLFMEKSGYMNRVIYLADRWMKPFGMSGRSLVPLISGTACAVPAILSTRSIENSRQRLITILSVPFTTCSARLPVYTIMISLVVPHKTVGYIFNMQGLVMTALYFLGFFSAFALAYVLNKIFPQTGHKAFIMMMPSYQWPHFKDFFIEWIDKLKAFVFGAGKIILTFSVVLWFLGSHGIRREGNRTNLMAYPVSLDQSYLGKLGKRIEPVFRPLGYDWKIDIALLSSFAAREIFVGTLSTLYSVNNNDDNMTLTERLRAQIRPATGKPFFDLATGVSILLFYVFALQCMSTLSVIRTETGTWKYALGLFVFMGVLAWTVSFAAYQLLKVS